jgi:hypothetical protein
MKHISKITLILTGMMIISLMTSCKSTEGTKSPSESATDVEAVVSTDEISSSEPEVTEEVNEATSADTTDSNRKAFIDFLVTNPNLMEVRTFVFEHIASADESLADDMLTELIARSDAGVWEEMDVIFLEENSGIHDYIFGIYELNKEALGNGYVFMGDAKNILLDLMEDVDYRMILEDLFEKGYGIYSAEGAYYPVVDYLAYKKDFGHYVSEMSNTYLDILADVIIEPTTIEEYLALTPEALKVRAFESETFLMTYPEAPLEFKKGIGRNLLTCLWKLSSPNILDGMLDEDFTVSDNLKATYDAILKERTTPIVTSTVESVTRWIQSDEDGILGSLDDMDELNGNSSEIFNNVLKQMEALYPMQLEAE